MLLSSPTSLQPLLLSRTLLEKSEGGVEVCQRRYKKVLVISPHEFYTA